MFFRKCMVMTLGIAAGMLSAIADDTATLPQSFEGATVEDAVTTLTGWTGYGTISNTTDQTNLAAGVPITGNHTKHLAVEGWVTAAFDTTTASTNDRELDMLVKVALPDDTLSTMSDADAKFALAIDTDKKLKYWNKPASGTASWVAVSDTAYNEGQWIRVAIVYAQGAQRCKVSVDGSAATAGYASTTSTTAGTGPWFPMLTNTTTFASMKIVGTTEIDDVVLGMTEASSYVPSYNDAEGNPKKAGTTDVTLAWVDKNGLSTNDLQTADASGLTYEQKFIIGRDDAKSMDKFQMQAVSMTKDGDTVKVSITAPTFTLPSSAYSAKVQYSTDGTTWSDGTAITSGGTVDVALPAGSQKVTKFRIQVTK